MIYINIEYKSIDERNIWKPVRIPLNILTDGYARTEYVETKTGDFVIEFKYKPYIGIPLAIYCFIYNLQFIHHYIRYKIKQLHKKYKNKQK